MDALEAHGAPRGRRRSGYNDCVSNYSVPTEDRPRRFAPDELAAWRGFLRAHGALTRALDAELVEAHDLPLTSYEVLLHLYDAPEGQMRMSELAEAVLLSRSGLTRLADRLELAGLIERRDCPSDARGLLAVITDEGRRLFRRAGRTHVEGVRRRFLDRLTSEEQRSLADVWERLLGDA
jgi:DNA-binding MarR family transcriptional regulator